MNKNAILKLFIAKVVYSSLLKIYKCIDWLYIYAC